MASFKWDKTGLFAAGILFGTAGIKLLSSKDAKKVYTECTAAVLRAKDCVMKTVTTVQENAGDIYADAQQINEDRKAAEEPFEDEDVARIARENGSTRATASMDKAAGLDKKLIFAIGNAPTALVRLYELIEEKKLDPKLIIGVPVGFVNVVQSKELIMHTNVPYIVARGRKGGSNIAACICNALLYMIDNNRG